MRILIVDDESKTRAGLIRLITRLDPESVVVGEAENGYDGMMLIKECHPDVVITDIMMPRINGLDMIANTREIFPGTHFLILSGYAEFELARRAIKLSAVDYLLKPITVDQMRIALLSLKETIKGSHRETAYVSTTENHGAKEYGFIATYIINEIKNHYADCLYMDDIARRIGLTPEYAGNVFSKETGKTFSAYLRDVRMKKAMELLETTGNKIYEIAYKTGYSDEKYFCRVFKEYTGVPPKKYLRSLLPQKGCMETE